MIAVPLVGCRPPGSPSACGADVSRIDCENRLPGSPRSEWGGSDDGSIRGFTTEFSVNRGEDVRFKIDTTATAYSVDIYRIGWYQGLGARKVATITPAVALPQTQPPCLNDAATGLVDCGNWAESASWNTGSALSGVYVAVLRRPDTGGIGHVYFVVREDGHASQVLFQTNDTTWQAYNFFGRSLYGGLYTTDRARAVSYNRPFVTLARTVQFFSDQYPMIRFLERNGYDVTYVSGVDTARRPAELRLHQLFVSAGHDEYWSGDQRANVEAARDAGVNLAFFSGNEVFWKTRWQPSIDGTGTPYRTMVCYKETLDGAKTDPSPQWTGTWRDARFSPPSDGGRPEYALTGTSYRVNGPRNDAITVPAADGRMRMWRNTSVASQAADGVATLPTGTLGYEWDDTPDGPGRPPGLVDLSTTTVDVTNGDYLLDEGRTYGNGTATHHLTIHRAPSGALVFGAGTVQWSWGLDGAAADARMQQATVNLLADLGAEATTLMTGLVKATRSTDSTPPGATVGTPGPGAALPVGVPATLSGTASDAGGGRVGAVEVSTDGGSTWHPAVGRETWSYSWTPSARGSVTLQVRAVDDSANRQRTPVTVAVNVT